MPRTEDKDAQIRITHVLMTFTENFFLVHEGTLVTALNMMSLWCAKFYTNVPDKLIEWFKVMYLHNVSDCCFLSTCSCK